MRKIKIKTKVTKREVAIVFIAISAYITCTTGFNTTVSVLEDILMPVQEAYAQTDKAIVIETPQVIVKTYAYNELVPKEIVEAEIRKQAREFGLGEQVMVNLAICESGLNNLVKNKNSTALGVYQYLIGTWQETESFINKKIARTDYKANIREAMIDISNGEEWRWECWK